MQGIQFGRFEPDPNIDEGRMLAASGSLTATITSRVTSRHMTVRLRCSRRDENGVTHWPTVAFGDAAVMFIDSFDGEAIAAYELARGVLRFTNRATPAAQWTVTSLLRYLAGVDNQLVRQAELSVMSHCMTCGRPLTDPESIERGRGPVCQGAATGSRVVSTQA